MRKSSNFKKIAEQDYYDSNGVLLVPKGKALDLQTWVKVKKHSIKMKEPIGIFVVAEDSPKKEIVQKLLNMEVKYDILDDKMILYTYNILRKLLLKDNNPWDLHLRSLSNFLYFVYSHTINTSILVIMMGIKYGYDEEKLTQLALGSLLHDVGELLVPKDILLKDTDLSLEEYGILKKHPELGFSMIQDLPISKESKKMVLCHHERLDGSGYPSKLKEKDLIEEVKLLMVADAFDAMTSYRVYRETMGIEGAYQHLCDNKDKYCSKAIATIGKIFSL